MDIYTNPAKNTYVTGITKFFMMPTDSGGVPAVAVSKRASVYISSTYTILMILIFMVGWKLILVLIMAFWPTSHDPSRVSALVALWNSGESMNAAVLMGGYCNGMMAHILRRGKESDSEEDSDGHVEEGATTGGDPKTTPGEKPTTTTSLPSEPEKSGLAQEAPPPSPTSTESISMSPASNLSWGILFLLIACLMTAGNILSGLLVPVQLSMGNLVPPAKDAIFYPDVVGLSQPGDNGAGLAKLTSLKAPSALRALGSIEASDVTIRPRLSVEKLDPPHALGGWAGVHYHYEVTGVDMGLQTDPKLMHKVVGECRTDDTWLMKSTNDTNDTNDTYRLFGGNGNYTIKPQLGNLPPMVRFEIDVEKIIAAKSTRNVSFAMIVNTAGRLSYSAGSDPWYATEKSQDNARIAYQVSRGRPVLSCWQTTMWELNGQEQDTENLSKLPGLKLDKFWSEIVFPNEFGLPRVASVGGSAGAAALKSASYTIAPDFILDAGASSIFEDLLRLVVASWVSSRNIVRDTTTYGKPKNMLNTAEGGRGSVPDSVAKFVLQSGDVDTLSVRILIAVPVILLSLILIESLLAYVFRHSQLGQDPILRKGGRNSVDLLAPHLYRALRMRIDPKEKWERKESDVPLLFLPKTPAGHGEIQST